MTVNERLNIVPVLLGADLNCYHIARAFHEEYGVISHAFGRYQIGATKYTKIVKFNIVENFTEPSVMTATLNRFAEEHKGASLPLFGCTDEYVSLIAKNRAALSDAYTIPYIDAELMDKITLKEHFYELCEKYGIPYPKTVVYEKGGTLDGLPFSYPIIIKPSSSTMYWKHPFDGMKKVYRARDAGEAEKIIGDIYGSGYPGHLILQDTIPGDDSHMYVLTAYSDRNAKVRMMCLGHVLLEEHTPKGLGNHAAIITEKNDALMDIFKKFLEDLGYVGFSNFDIKYDERDGTMRAFEINTRLGRSNYYITAAGNNPALYIVEDYLLGKNLEGCVYSGREIYWRYIPDSIVFRYITGELAQRVKKLKREKAAYSSMRYKFDLHFNLRRRIFVALHEYNHINKFKKYYVKQ